MSKESGFKWIRRYNIPTPQNIESCLIDLHYDDRPWSIDEVEVWFKYLTEKQFHDSISALNARCKWDSEGGDLNPTKESKYPLHVYLAMKESEQVMDETDDLLRRLQRTLSALKNSAIQFQKGTENTND